MNDLIPEEGTPEFDAMFERLLANAERWAKKLECVSSK